MSRRDWTRSWREKGTRCLIHRIEPILQHTEDGGYLAGRVRKSRRPPSGTRHSTREVLSGFSGAFKCFRSCLECHKRLLETEEETGFLIGPRRNHPTVSTLPLADPFFPFDLVLRSAPRALPRPRQGTVQTTAIFEANSFRRARTEARFFLHSRGQN